MEPVGPSREKETSVEGRLRRPATSWVALRRVSGQMSPCGGHAPGEDQAGPGRVSSGVPCLGSGAGDQGPGGTRGASGSTSTNVKLLTGQACSGSASETRRGMQSVSSVSEVSPVWGACQPRG